MTALDDSQAKELRTLFDQEFYLERYPDVRASGMDPLQHYIEFGADEGRDPNRFFDGQWYRTHNPDVAASGLDPLLHYLRFGAQELRNPHPHFDAAWYAEQHLEAAANPMIFHLLFGRQRGWVTERPVNFADFLPSRDRPPSCPEGVVVDIVIPVYRGFRETRCCLDSVLADPDRPPGRIIVIDDRSPEPRLTEFLNDLKAAGRILLLRNRRNLGFVASANAGMQAAGDHDVVLLNADTQVPHGWLARLAGHAYAEPRIASVSPFSNNATICSYPSIAGGPPAFDLSMADLDDACRSANAGRHVEVPTTVGFCMYMRRSALKDVGPFDSDAFGRGYGEENDFCLRATARGWRHLLACDTFVFHAGKVSFGTEATSQSDRGQRILATRWPNYSQLVARHVRQDDAAPARFAVTAALFRRFARPVILLVSHALGGGVRRHISEVVQRSAGKADFLMVESVARGIALSVPALPGHSTVVLPAERIEEIASMLRSAGVTRVHIHHLMGVDLNMRRLIQVLDVPFDLTVHDYYTICPQVNLLPWLDAQYCGEPPPATCNACIADRPSHGARDITSWRGQHAWLFHEADRVLCPSKDVIARLRRFGLAARAVHAPHEPVTDGLWPVTVLRLAKGQKLRVAVLGVLAEQKGASTVTRVIEAADPDSFDFRLIGHPEHELPRTIGHRLYVSGEYKDTDLPSLLAKSRPHVVWFPAQWPETYSYTLSAAIEAGLPIVASRIGAFPERLETRPLTWLVDPGAPAADWLSAFAAARTAMTARTPPPRRTRQLNPDFYKGSYVQSAKARSSRTGERRARVVVIPERFASGGLTPCAYIRLLQPLDHIAAPAGLDIVVTNPQEALHCRPELIITQRHAAAEPGIGEALLRHCRDHDIPLVYDLDDDLMDVPGAHPDAPQLRPLMRNVERMLRGAGTIWVSTPALRQRLRRYRDDGRVVPNALDERIWADPLATRLGRQAPVRILFMGTLTHDDDFALVEPVLARLHAELPGRVSFDMIGVSARQHLPDWVHRVPLSVCGNLSYPGFVNWLIQQPGWDIGVAPLVGTAFNAAKSAIKIMDYAALGLAVLASDVPAYRTAVSPEFLVTNDQASWYQALSRLVRDTARRQRMAAEARAAFRSRWTLESQSEDRRAAVIEALSARSRQQPRVVESATKLSLSTPSYAKHRRGAVSAA